ncbi:MAG: type I 3-dehydroquinate dehydratase [Lachnospiraceae bacterium]|nr:type I 3-dehydroquinate dehydratase [Lachnospiraceae bacterium]
MGRNEQEVLSEAKRVIDQGASMIEWRIDYLEKFADIDVVNHVMDGLGELTKDVVLLATLRTKMQGGEADISESTLKDYYIELARMQVADIIDVEFFELEKPEKVVSKMQEIGAVVITSHHDFDETPQKPTMEMIFEDMAKGGADIVKLAVMPQSLQDVLDLLQVTYDFSTEYDGIEVASMSMGKMGVISRLCGEVFGSCITFGTMGDASAPGQINEAELSQILNIVHNNFINS